MVYVPVRVRSRRDCAKHARLAKAKKAKMEREVLKNEHETNEDTDEEMESERAIVEETEMAEYDAPHVNRLVEEKNIREEYEFEYEVNDNLDLEFKSNEGQSDLTAVGPNCESSTSTPSSSNHSTCSTFSSPFPDSQKDSTIEDLRETLKMKEDEFAVFSRVMFDVREELIDTRNDAFLLTRKNQSISTTIVKTMNSRNFWRKKSNQIFLKNERLQSKLKPIKLRRIPTKNRKNHYVYSNIKNESSKIRRQEEAVSDIQDISEERDISEFIKDIMKYANNSDDHLFQCKLTPLQSVLVKTRANLTCDQFRYIKKMSKAFLGFDIFPPLNVTIELAKEVSKVELFEASTHSDTDEKRVTVVQCTDIESILKWRLELLSASNQLLFDSFTEDDIAIAFGGDSGGGTTKLCILIGNVASPNSTKHILTVGVFNDTDTYVALAKHAQPLIDQLNQLKTITFKENGVLKTRNVRQYVVGDFKFVCESLSHMKQAALFFCPFCFAKNPKGKKQIKLKDIDLTVIHKSRSLETYEEDAKAGRRGVYKGDGPLLKNVKLIDYLMGLLHLIVGVFLKYIYQPLWMMAVSLDNTTRFDIFADKERTIKKANGRILELSKQLEACNQRREKKKLQKRMTEMEKERETLDQILDGVDGGCLKKFENACEAAGASKRAFFQTFNGNHIKKLLTPKGITLMFGVFSNNWTPKLSLLKKSAISISIISSLSSNRILNTFDLDNLKCSIKTFVNNLKEASPEETITQKLHVLIYHVLDVAKQNWTLGRLSEQGLEATHAYFNRLERRLCSRKNKEDRYKLAVQELLCSNFVSDLYKEFGEED